MTQKHNRYDVYKDGDEAGTRRERRKQEFRDRIIDAAIGLFERQGCDATTLEEICATADISRPTFYSYYASKKELIQALGDKLWLNVASELTTESLANFSSTQAYIESFFALVQREVDKYNCLERELIRQSMTSGPGDDGSVNIMKGLTGLFASVYQEGRRRGELSERYPIDFLAEMTMGSINAVMMNWAIDEDFPIQTRLEQLADYIPRMLTLDR